MANEIEIDVPCGLNVIKFSISRTGPTGCDTDPGLGYVLCPYPNLSPSARPHGSGVISRDDAKRLRDLIDRLLAVPVGHGPKAVEP